MADTITFRGRTYRLGEGGTPLDISRIAPATCPPGWHEIAELFGVGRDYARAYRSQTGLLVLLTVSIEADRKRWLHCSVSHRGGRLPTWRELCEIKAWCIGEEQTAYQVHPPSSKHVSIKDNCLHLWSPLDGPVTPDFTRGGETI